MKVTENADIINLVPKFKKKSRMAREQRAKIFAPFSALKGFEQVVAEKQKVVVPKAELSQDSKEELDLKVQILLNELWNENHPVVTLIYFKEYKRPKSYSDFVEDCKLQKQERDEAQGEYLKVTGMLTNLDVQSLTIQIVNDKYSLGDIYTIESDIFEL